MASPYRWGEPPDRMTDPVGTWAAGGAELLRKQLAVKLQLETARNNDVKMNLGLAEERVKADALKTRNDELRVRCEQQDKELTALRDGQEYLLQQYENLGKEYHEKLSDKDGALVSIKDEIKSEVQNMESRLKQREASLLSEAEAFRGRLRDLEGISGSKDDIILKMEGQVEFARGSLEGAVASNTRLEEHVSRVTSELDLERKHSATLAMEVSRLEAAINRGAQLYVEACSELEGATAAAATSLPPEASQDARAAISALQSRLDEREKVLTQCVSERNAFSRKAGYLESQLSNLTQMLDDQQAMMSQQAPVHVSMLSAATPNVQTNESNLSSVPQTGRVQEQMFPLRGNQVPNQVPAFTHSPQPVAVGYRDAETQSPQRALDDMSRLGAKSPVVVEPIALRMQSAIMDLQRLTSPVPVGATEPSNQLVKEIWNKLLHARLTDAIEIAQLYQNASINLSRTDQELLTYKDVAGAKDFLSDLAKEVPGFGEGKGLAVTHTSGDDNLFLINWVSPGIYATETLILQNGVICRHNVSLMRNKTVSLPPAVIKENVITEQVPVQTPTELEEKVKIQTSLIEQQQQELSQLRKQVVSADNISYHEEVSKLRSQAIQGNYDSQKLRETEQLYASAIKELESLKEEATKIDFWQAKVRSLVFENESLKADTQKIRENLVTHQIESGGTPDELTHTVQDLAASASALIDIRQQRDHLREELSRERQRSHQLKLLLDQSEQTRLRVQDTMNHSEAQVESLTTTLQNTSHQAASEMLGRETAEENLKSTIASLHETQRQLDSSRERCQAWENQFASMTAT